MNLIFRDIYSKSIFFTFLRLLLNLGINIANLISPVNWATSRNEDYDYFKEFHEVMSSPDSEMYMPKTGCSIFVAVAHRLLLAPIYS